MGLHSEGPEGPRPTPMATDKRMSNDTIEIIIAIVSIVVVVDSDVVVDSVCVVIAIIQ